MQPFDLQERTVPHLKDLINICLENESQGLGMTFNIILIAQSTLISYHTEAFVKTEVACTVRHRLVLAKRRRHGGARGGVLRRQMAMAMVW